MVLKLKVKYNNIYYHPILGGICWKNSKWLVLYDFCYCPKVQKISTNDGCRPLCWVRSAFRNWNDHQFPMSSFVGDTALL